MIKIPNICPICDKELSGFCYPGWGGIEYFYLSCFLINNHNFSFSTEHNTGIVSFEFTDFFKLKFPGSPTYFDLNNLSKSDILDLKEYSKLLMNLEILK